MRAFALVVMVAACRFAPNATGVDDASPPTDDAPPPIDGAPDAAIDASPDAGIDLTAGLIAHYEMESIAGNVALDSTGNNHAGACTACPTTVAGKIGNGFHFDGTQRVAAAGDGLQTAGGFTVAVWVRFTSLPASGFACLGGKVLGTQFANSWQICYQAQTQDLVLVTAPNAGNVEIMTTGITPTVNTFVHVAATWDTTAKALSVNGTLIKTVAAAIAYDNQPMTFGGDIDNGNLSATLTGDLDDLRIYDHALAPEAIQLLANP